MIICERHALAILTPPKAGSAAMHRTLCRPDGGCLTVYSPDPSGAISKHGVVVPLEWTSQRFRVAAIVRNPYDRLVSQYTHYCNWLTCQGLAAPSLLAYLTSPPDHLVFGWSLCRALDAARPDEIWKLEELPGHLHRLGLPTVPRDNTSWHLPTRDLLKPELWALADQRTEDDRRAFGYPSLAESQNHGR